MPPVERRMKDVLRCPEKQNNYDETDIHSIFQYALGIEGKTLLTILQEAGLTEEEIAWVHSKESDKGLPGKIVEASYFGYELNSRQEADFETVGAELKTNNKVLKGDYSMNCVNYVKKTVCMVLMLAFVLISCLGAFATSENPKKLGILASSIKITDTKVEYIEYKDDGAYFVEETISGNIITSDFYKISNGEKIHSSQIISSVSGKNVISRETDANGQVTTYSVKGIVSRDTNEKSIVPYAIRTDNYSISLVGKKVTIASAAMAITLVSNYIPTTGAEDIIKKAIVVVAGAVGAGVACLPDYLYVTSVLSMHKSVGKIYYVYENDYYLDSNKSQLIGHWTFRHRSGH